MFKSKKLSLSLLTLSISSAILLTACGGDGTSGSSQPPAAATLTGRVVDGPIAGATVTFTDEATACKGNSATTDANGVFTFPAGCTASAIKVTGGQDTTTGLPFAGTLEAPKMSLTDVQGVDVVVTPITTLIVAAGGEAQAPQIAAALGLTGNLLTADPLSNPALLSKTTAVQQLIEQLSTAIITLDNNSTLTSEITQKAITSALVSQLKALPTGTTIDFTNVNTINTLIQNTVKDSNVKDELPETIKANINNVATNLAALTSASIAANVKAVEDTIKNLTAGQLNSAQALKDAAQEKILAEKNDSTTVNLLNTLGQVLTKDSADISSALKDIAEAAVTGTATDKLTNAISVIEAETGVIIPKEAITEAGIFTNYLQLKGLNLQGTTYNLDNLTASLTTPIKVTSLDNILVPLDSAGTYKTSNQTISASLKFETATKALLISANTLNLTYSNGVLTAAILPKGSTVELTSTAAGLNSSLTLTTDIDVLSNGQIALNSTNLGKISASLVSSLNKFNSEKGTASITTIISPGQGQVIAATSSSFAMKHTISLLSKSVTGYGTVSKVTVE